MESFNHDQVAIVASYATSIHRGQYRKSLDNSKTPYIAHLYDVASILISAGASSDEVCAGLLHDAIEDQGGNPQAENISRMFGSDVRTLVEGCTDSTSTEPDKKLPWEQRKKAYIKHFETASDSVRRVSCADKISNMRAIIADLEKTGNNTWNLFCRSIERDGKKNTLPLDERREKVLWYHDAIGKVVDDNSATIGKLADLYTSTLGQLHIAAETYTQ
jgi:(p)ppGpp synthase/HD superfamily hydrolase